MFVVLSLLISAETFAPVSQLVKLPPHGLQPDIALPTLPPGQATIQEVFSSVQGEGLWVGHRQLFIRVAHCHLACAYCDTPMRSATGLAYVQTLPGVASWQPYPNPMTADTLLTSINTLLQEHPHHSISLTGGEPLLYPDFTSALFARLQALGYRTYLETSGTQPKRLAKVLPVTNMVAMDIKLASATRQPTPWEAHAEFLKLAVAAAPESEVFVKLVVNQHTEPEELKQVATLMQACLHVPVFIQPQTPLTETLLPMLSAEKMLSFQTYLLTQGLQQVRVVPQTHKQLCVD